MSLHLAAQHLSSKGRNGDNALVHVSKGELAGLQALAQAHGKTLTTNPQTGLPEAFSLKSLLPMAAGAALMATGVGAPLAAAMVGGGMWAATGSLKQGLMAGLGAYGGAGLMGGLGAMGAEAGTQAVAGEVAGAGEAAAQNEVAKQAALEQAGQEAVTPQAIEKVATEQATRNAVGNQAAWEQSAREYAENSAGNTFELSGGYRPTFGPEAMGPQIPSSATAVGPQMPGTTLPAVTPSGTQFTAATQQTLANPYEAGLKAAYNNPSAYVDKLGGGMETAKLAGAAAAPAIADAMTPKPYQAPEIKGDADMGQRYAYESGYDNSIPGRTAPPSYTQISNEEAKKLYGFAEGGDVQNPYAWSQGGQSVVRMADGGAASSGYGPGGPAGDYSGYGVGAPAGNYSGYGVGAPVGNYSGYDTPVATGIAAAAPAAARSAARTSTLTTPAKGVVYDPVSKTFIGPGANAEYLGGGQWGLTAAEQAAADKAAADAAASAVSDSGGGYAAGGNISTLGGYSDGGRLLKGPGDGMSDNIPAQIGSKQPARLADGEFVVPADVVSHLGNGSTDAGAKQLYKMMDKIRQARTGRKAQGKQINPNKFIPV